MTDDLSKLSDDELLQRYIDDGGEAGDPENDRLAEEIKRRNLDF